VHDEGVPGLTTWSCEGGAGHTQGGLCCGFEECAPCRPGVVRGQAGGLLAKVARTAAHRQPTTATRPQERSTTFFRVKAAGSAITDVGGDGGHMRGRWEPGQLLWCTYSRQQDNANRAIPTTITRILRVMVAVSSP